MYVRMYIDKFRQVDGKFEIFHQTKEFQTDLILFNSHDVSLNLHNHVDQVRI